MKKGKNICHCNENSKLLTLWEKTAVLRFRQKVEKYLIYPDKPNILNSANSAEISTTLFKEQTRRFFTFPWIDPYKTTMSRCFFVLKARAREIWGI